MNYPKDTPYPENQTYDISDRSPNDLYNRADKGRDYGSMPSELLASKFEETNTGDDELLYIDYVRREISDWRPVEAKFEYEEARGAVNGKSATLQNRYYGHRGTAEVDKPEMFLGFGGPGDKDPRGINTEVDLKKLRLQEEARMKFIRLDKDACEQITGGGRSEGKTMADLQSQFRRNRVELKTFNRQMDGKREGLRRVYKHKSEIPKQINVQSYGDLITDVSLNPQRRANIICKEIRNTSEFRAENCDQDLEIAKYSSVCALTRKQNRKMGTVDVLSNTRGESELAESDNATLFKTSCVLVSQLIANKKESMCGGDAHDTDSANISIRKAALIANDLNIVLNAMQETDFAKSDLSLTGKGAVPQIAPHNAKSVILNHISPINHESAEIIYKTVKAGDDPIKINKNISIALSVLPENNSFVKKNLLPTISKNNNTVEDADRKESSNTASYKSLTAKVANASITNGENYKKESDDMQTKKQANAANLPNVVNKKNLKLDSLFGDNACKERRARSIGNKYMNRYMDRDGKDVIDF